VKGRNSGEVGARAKQTITLILLACGAACA